MPKCHSRRLENLKKSRKSPDPDRRMALRRALEESEAQVVVD